MNILQFGFEGWWITDLSSYLTENLHILSKQLKIQNYYFNYCSKRRINDSVACFERYQRLLQNAYIALQASKALLNLTAEEKILD
jgi:hypothetical protein